MCLPHSVLDAAPEKDISWAKHLSSAEADNKRAENGSYLVMGHSKLERKSFLEEGAEPCT